MRHVGSPRESALAPPRCLPGDRPLASRLGVKARLRQTPCHLHAGGDAPGLSLTEGRPGAISTFLQPRVEVPALPKLEGAQAPETMSVVGLPFAVLAEEPAQLGAMEEASILAAE